MRRVHTDTGVACIAGHIRLDKTLGWEVSVVWKCHWSAALNFSKNC
jgi:G:T-mismatch repair DNA endonuclease (very short patch repair protein)